MRGNVSRKMTYAAAILISVAFFVLSGYNYYLNHSGQKTKEGVVNSYIKAIRNNDPEAIQRLTLNEFDASREAENEVKEFGGKDLRIKSVSYDNSVTPSSAYFEVTIIGSKNGKEFTKKIIVQGMGDKFYLMIGKVKPEFSVDPKIHTSVKDYYTSPSSTMTDKEKEILKSCQAQDNGCCVASLKAMTSREYVLPENNACPTGYQMNSLDCPGSLNWCEKVK
ncbi:hypothetical protein A2Y26_00765 [candidate division CPR2 bacterium GWD2_39_7]|nr:MAG: hypothetical protein UT47_C0003G0007 [candidate division CPR2 bacterium GW2011_GWC2_39_35]KKR27296.1 MAG: hypothetical protein UT60_C0054G0001 [candidate division CPR2 bacterium GW2011_GWD2_39_7]KKR28223.1 MAG: hypothetical protein UT59_C0032G0007 [candidate division CPR2 bacterium GW2011_GWD1_39_7]OGB60423.1 MAG: hypothetical protein A2Y27_00220 [candidate division CPR2 bacterium GWD1_39_7]OGB70515.1 MAG: hypothetical protein A2Y26_00765 [candidate division CPR2 bacterium GWD2_39_7]HC